MTLLEALNSTKGRNPIPAIRMSVKVQRMAEVDGKVR